jgi:hypothetical protein
MWTRARLYLAWVVLLLLITVGCVGRSALVTDAQTTYQKYMTAINQGVEQSQPDIPMGYWEAGIRERKPLRVYVDRSNVVLVLAETVERESGLYITLPLSSYIPQNGDSDFSFTKMDDDIYSYTRPLP